VGLLSIVSLVVPSSAHRFTATFVPSNFATLQLVAFELMLRSRPGLLDGTGKQLEEEKPMPKSSRKSRETATMPAPVKTQKTRLNKDHKETLLDYMKHS
jgi:hypothetical protein